MHFHHSIQYMEVVQYGVLTHAILFKRKSFSCQVFLSNIKSLFGQSALTNTHIHIYQVRLARSAGAVI